jgi:hypothetical protein
VGEGHRIGDLEKELEPGAHGKSLRVGEAIDAQAVDELQDGERLPGAETPGVVETRDTGDRRDRIEPSLRKRSDPRSSRRDG